eukprot:6193742-Pleurochrysis_carterae.AAC.4
MPHRVKRVYFTASAALCASRFPRADDDVGKLAPHIEDAEIADHQGVLYSETASMCRPTTAASQNGNLSPIAPLSRSWSSEGKQMTDPVARTGTPCSSAQAVANWMWFEPVPLIGFMYRIDSANSLCVSKNSHDCNGKQPA